MADLSFSASLNDRGFQAGLDRMEKGVQKFAKSFKFLAAGAAALKAVQLIDDGIDAYAKKNYMAAQAVATADKAHTGFLETLGKMTYGLKGLEADFWNGASAALRWGDSISSAIADVFRGSGHSAMLDEANARAEALTKEWEVMKKQAETVKELSGIKDRLGFERVKAENPGDAGMLSALQDAREERKKILELAKGLTLEQRAGLGVDRMLADIEKDKERAYQARAKEVDKALNKRREELDLEYALERVNILRIEGKDKEAEAQERALKSQQKMLDLSREINLTERDRQRALENFSANYRDTENAIAAAEARKNREITGGRVLGAGQGGSAGFNTAVLGRPGGGDSTSVLRRVLEADKESAKATTEAAKTLKEISAKVDKLAPAYR